MDDDELRRWGIEPDYTDTSGHPRRSPDHALQLVLDQLRRADPDVPPAAVFVRTDGDAGSVAVPEGFDGGELRLEDGSTRGTVHGSLPDDLPLGYHSLTLAGQRIDVIVSPGRCHLPPDLRAWGWAVQLYGARSRDSWGMGDLGDAATIGRWMTDLGQRVGAGTTPLLLVNPLHAVNAGPDPAASPYFAGSRCFDNPLYLRVDDVPGRPGPQGATRQAVDELATIGRALDAAPTIDRRAVWAAKSAALALIWSEPDLGRDRRVAAALAGDPDLASHSWFNVACELHGGDWSTWPSHLRHPEARGWALLAADPANVRRAHFHAWLQLLVHAQLDAVQGEVDLLLDLAIGANPGGFDTWYWQDLFVLDGTRIGAPPDDFNTQGQDWGLPPLDPGRLRAAGYEPFIRMLRAGFAHSAGLRIDHVLGLFRLFWIPAGCEAHEGVYVRQPTSDLLDLVALESVRAGGIVVGEDLGTVGPGVREELAHRNLLSYRVMSLDDQPPAHFPAQSLASFTTHDLPTLPGLWTGADLAAQQRLDLHPNAEGTEHARHRLAAEVGLGLDAPVDEVVAGAYRQLAHAPSAVVLGQLEDTVGVVDRPNMPGTVDQWPNWVQALPEPIEDLLEQPLTTQVAEDLARR